MMKLTINPLLILTIIFLFGCNKEVKHKNGTFSIDGQISVDLDSIGIYPGLVKKDFVEAIFDFHYPVNDNNFKITGEIPHPYMFNFISRETGMSKPFFVERGRTELDANFPDNNRTVIITEATKSDAQKEYEKLKREKLDSLESLKYKIKSREEREKVNVLINTSLMDYLKDNPNSYVALWLIVDRFCIYGSKYNEIYEESLDYFSDEIKQSQLHQKFKEDLLESKDKTFKEKELLLKNTSLEKEVVQFSKLNKKYILLDFWHTRCAPCLREMPKYKPIYDTYKNLGFEIVSISVDEKEDIEQWKTLIEEKQFNWIHYLDEGKEEARKLEITGYPTTFLINSEGAIIEQDISSEELNSFLQKKLVSTHL